MTETVDPLDGVSADHVARAGVAYAEHAILVGDRLLINTRTEPAAGALVVAVVDDAATVRRFAEGMRVLGVLEAVVRRLP